jgi:hypothetical protein
MAYPYCVHDEVVELYTGSSFTEDTFCAHLSIRFSPQALCSRVQIPAFPVVGPLRCPDLVGKNFGMVKVSMA